MPTTQDNRIYISTGGHKDTSAYEFACTLIQNGIRNVELSGGAFENFDVRKLIALLQSAKLQVHNYYPPVEHPFVFKQASKQDSIVKESFALAENAITIASQINRPIYSFHAGFLVDPKTDELGKIFVEKAMINRDEGLELFIHRVNKLSQFAKSNDVELLIENNVISLDNYNSFGCDPMLMTTAKEAKYIMENTPGNVNMLLDVAHLKVSSNSLGLDSSEMFTLCDDWIKAYHLSDNDGTEDSNEPIRNNSWFWPYIKFGKLFYTLEVYGLSVDQYHTQIELLERNLA